MVRLFVAKDDTAAGQASSGKITAKVEEKTTPAEQSKDQVKVARADAAAKALPDGKAAEIAAEQVARDKALKEAQERLAVLEKNFNELDKDKNGVVDSREMSADKTRILGKSDKNKDGKVTQQESSSQFQEYFREMDANKDSQVSEDEYTDY